VTDYVESHGKYEEVKGRAYDDVLFATVAQMAETYVKRRAEKGSQQSTPMSGYERTHLDMLERLIGNVRERLGQLYQFPEGFKQFTKPDSGNDKKYTGTPKFSKNWRTG